MKKIILLMLMFFPLCVVNASANSNKETIVSEKTSYFKTTTFYGSEENFLSVSHNTFFSETIEITEQEYLEAKEMPNELSKAYNTIETTYKKLKVSILTDADKYKYKAELEWKKMPKVRSYDILGIGFYRSVKALSISYNTHYCLNNGSCYTTNSYYAKNVSGGVGATFQLPTSSEVKSIKSTLTANIDKNVTDATIIEQMATAEYVHAQKNITSALAREYSIGVTGIDLNSNNISYYDNMGAVSVSINCNW